MPKIGKTKERYEVFMIDPPWSQRKGGVRKSRSNQGRDLDYATLSIEEIFRLLDTQVFSQATEVHTVFLWSIDKFLFAGEEEMAKRGYTLHARMVWDKGNGVAPAFTIRYSHEYLLWFYKPKMLPVAENMRGKFRTVFREDGREHSRKPRVAYVIVDCLYPDATKIDVFSRQKREGWSQFGDEVSHFKGG